MDLEKELAKIKDFQYNDYLDWFRRLNTTVALDNEKNFKTLLPMEGWAAYLRWSEIFEKPSKIDKLLQGQLKNEREADIMDAAVGDDDEAFWSALIRENVDQLNSSNVSPQEVARLTQNLGIFRDKLHECRSRKPKVGTPLERAQKAAAMLGKKPPKAKNKHTTKKAKTTGVKRASETASKTSKIKKTTKSASKGGKK